MTTDAGKTRARDIGSGVLPVTAVAAAETALAPPAGGTGAQAGCYDSAANRNLAIVSLTAGRTDLDAIRTELVALGIVAGGVSDVGKTRARDIGSGKPPVLAVSVTATMLAPPAGGTGQTAGGYDTAGNRNLFITSLTALRTDIDAMRTELSAIGLISGGASADGKTRARDIGTGRVPSAAVSIAVTQVAPPAGGSGADAGGYDSAANRNLMIVSLTACRTDIAALRTELVAVNIVAA